MKLNNVLLAAVAALGLATGVAQARPNRFPIQPMVGFGFNMAQNMVQPVVGMVKPCGHVVTQVVKAPVVFAPCVRPVLGFAFGSGPFNFGFSF